MRPNSDMVSRRHCMISMAKAGSTVRDLGSRNGTSSTARRSPASRNFAPGDKIKVGPLEFEVQLAERQRQEEAEGPQRAGGRRPHGRGRQASRRGADISDWLEDEMRTMRRREADHDGPFRRADQTPAEGGRRRSSRQQKIQSGRSRSAQEADGGQQPGAAADMLKQFFHRKP